jgi:type II secretory pathway component GspD/PulD (secretin)
MAKKTPFHIFVPIFLLLVLAPGIFSQSQQLINLDFKNTDIRDVLRVLANQANVNVVIDNEITGKVTLHLTKVSLTEALDTIGKNYNLTYTRSQNVFYITPVDNSSLEVEFADGQLMVAAKEVRIKKLFEVISAKTGMSFVPDADIPGKVSVFINRSPLQDAIKTLLTQTNCTEEKVGQISYIRMKSTPRYSFSVIYENQLLTVDAKEIPLNVLVREITEKTGVSIIPDQNLAPPISIYFQSLSLDEGLNNLCDAYNLKYYQENNSRRISKKNGVYRVTFKDKLLSVSADNVEVTEIFSEISRKTNLNIVLDREVTGKVTANFQNLPMFQGLSMLVENRGWTILKQSGCYFVKPAGKENKDATITYNPDNQLFDITIRTGLIASIISEMAQKADINIVVLSQVNWTLNNIRLQQVKFTDALDLLFKGTIFTYKYADGVYIIGDGLLVRPETADFSEVKSYPVKYLKADQLLNSLPPVFPRQSFMQLPNENTLIVSAPPAVQLKFSKYLNDVDIPDVKDRTEMIKINYLKAEDVMKLIPPSIPKNDLVIVKEANAIAVTGSDSTIAQVKGYIETIDQINPLIVFDIAVIQIENSNSINWEPPSGDISLGNGNKLRVNSLSGNQGGVISVINPKTNDDGKSDTTLGSITALVKNGKAKIVANPTITTLNSHPAKFEVATNRSYNVPTGTNDAGTVQNETVKTYKSGLSFEITPWVAANNQITMELKPKISEFGANPEGSALPSVSERSSETTVRVDDGQTIVISGLKRIRKDDSVRKVPFLGDIPLIGYFFKSKNRSETEDEFVIVITPSLVFGQSDQAKLNSISNEIADDIKNIRKKPQASQTLPESGPSKQPNELMAPDTVKEKPKRRSRFH